MKLETVIDVVFMLLMTIQSWVGNSLVKRSVELAKAVAAGGGTVAVPAGAAAGSGVVRKASKALSPKKARSRKND